MRGEKILVTEGFRGVLFQNFPAVQLNDFGAYECVMLDVLIAEEAVNDIPYNLRSSVTVDYSTLDQKYKKKVQQGLRAQINLPRKKLQESEEDLLKTIF